MSKSYISSQPKRLRGRKALAFSTRHRNVGYDVYDHFIQRRLGLEKTWKGNRAGLDTNSKTWQQQQANQGLQIFTHVLRVNRGARVSSDGPHQPCFIIHDSAISSLKHNPLCLVSEASLVPEKFFTEVTCLND
jgi:hypothetical protein